MGGVKIDDTLTRWYGVDEQGEEYLIKELDVVGELTEGYKELNCTRCEIGTHVTIIGASSFFNCSTLATVTIPNSVTSLCAYAFCQCVSLTSIYCNSINEPCSILGGVFNLGHSKGGTLHVAKGGSAATYPTWMNTQGNLGYSGNGTWVVVDDL